MKLDDYLGHVVFEFTSNGFGGTRIEVRGKRSGRLVHSVSGPRCDDPEKFANMLGIIAHEVNQLAAKTPDED